MTRSDGWDYAAVFAVTLALTLLLTPLALRIATGRKILDHPGPIKAQASPVPYLGGVAILISFVTVVLAAAVIRPPNSGLDELVIILGLAVVLAVIGLLDDLRGLSPFLRLGIEIAAGVIVWATPAGADIFALDGLNLAVTVLWIAGVTNAFNMLDNMDGLSGGVAAIASFFVFLLAVDNGQFLVATLAIGLSGCAVGFLRSNFHPARIYMGDAGAMFLGFLLAVLTMKIDYVNAPRSVALGVPLVVLGVPLFDFALVTVNRLIHRRNPLRGGRDHTSHRLVFVGIPIRVAVGLVYLGAASFGWLSLVIVRVDTEPALLLLGWIATVVVLTLVLLSQVPVYESSRRRRVMLRDVAAHEPEPMEAEREARRVVDGAKHGRRDTPLSIVDDVIEHRTGP